MILHWSLFTLFLLETLSGCLLPQYGQEDCDTLRGASARMCQEYRQRKADAKYREEAAEILKAYRLCLQKYEVEPAKAKENCGVYTQALHEIEIKSIDTK